MATTMSAEHPETHASFARKLPGRPQRVLVADDEHLVAEQIASLLTSLGYEIVGPASTGEEALRLAQSEHPDLALLDIRMPEGDGLATAHTLLRRNLIPSVILSAYSDEEYVRRAEENGVFAYLIKPVDEAQLRATLEVAWGRFRSYAETSTEGEKLRQQLNERKIVERAKWVLVKQAGVDEATAMRLMIEHSRTRREPLLTTAKRVIRTGANGEDVDSRDNHH